MTKRTLVLITGTLLCTLLLTGGALAMSSDHYRLDWFTPLTGSGGAASSTNYVVNFTVGQSVRGASGSTNYDVCLGYWCGEFEYRVFLPIVLRNYS